METPPPNRPKEDDDQILAEVQRIYQSGVSPADLKDISHNAAPTLTESLKALEKHFNIIREESDKEITIQFIDK